MTKAERQMLVEIHGRVEKMYNVKINGVDGSKPVEGFQPVMEYLNTGIKGVKSDVADLKTITHTLKTKREMKVAIDKYLADRWFVRLLYTFFTDKKTITTIILLIAGWFTHESAWKFIITLLK